MTMIVGKHDTDNNNVGTFEDHDMNNVVMKGSIAERRAATCGFDASNINLTRFRNAVVPPSGSQSIRSPYFTVPAGISPSALLDSPVMLPNDQVQLSPTTGTFHFSSTIPENCSNLKHELGTPYVNGNSNFTMESSTLARNEGHCQAFGEFKCPMDFQEMAKKNGFVDSFAMSYQSSGNNKSWSEAEPLNLQPGTTANDVFRTQNEWNGKDRSKNPSREKQQKGSHIPKDAEDGYYWRKYGQKQVKGSEYPRSYFKCTNMNCKVKKKVERSHDGDITEIVYSGGDHNHPKPQPVKRFSDELDTNEGNCVKSEGGVALSKDVTFCSDWRNDGVDGAFSTLVLSDYPTSLAKGGVLFEGQELSSTISSQEADDNGKSSPDSISFNGDEENGDCEPKKRKRETCPNETSTISRSNREPRVVVQLVSEIDILDDGYRWRKYGQKVVKGNPNPRSYYKCTTPGCPVRKHVERAANDIKSVVTAYEGRHNHVVPSSKNSSNLVISDVANLPSTVNGNNLSTPMVPKTEHLPRTGSQAQDMSMYLDQKPFLNYNDFMRSNLPRSYHPSGHDYNFSSPYPISLPYNPLFMNTNHMKTFPTSNMYPSLSDYMTMPAPMSHVAGHSNMPPLGNSYPAFQPDIRGKDVYKDRQPKIMKQEQEQRIGGGLYDTSCLSMPNHGNGTI